MKKTISIMLCILILISSLTIQISAASSTERCSVNTSDADSKMRVIVLPDIFDGDGGLFSGYYHFVNEDTLKAIDPKNQTTNSSIIEQRTLSGENQQSWDVISDGGGYYKIKNRKSQYWLTSPTSSSENAQITQESASLGSRQRWAITLLADGTYRIQAENRANTNLVMSVNSSVLNANTDGLNITQRQISNAGDRGKWRLASATLWNADNSCVLSNGSIANAAYWEKTTLSILCVKVTGNTIYPPEYFPPDSANIDREVWGNVVGMNFESSFQGGEDIQIYGGCIASIQAQRGLPVSSAVLGVTDISYSGSAKTYKNDGSETKNIYKISQAVCYIVFKPAGPMYDEEVARFSIIHELGHAMGYLGHSPVSTAGALMRADVTTLSEAVFTPTLDESKHLKKIYDMYH